MYTSPAVFEALPSALVDQSPSSSGLAAGTPPKPPKKKRFKRLTMDDYMTHLATYGQLLSLSPSATCLLSGEASEEAKKQKKKGKSKAVAAAAAVLGVVDEEEEAKLSPSQQAGDGRKYCYCRGPDM